MKLIRVIFKISLFMMLGFALLPAPTAAASGGFTLNTKLLRAKVEQKYYQGLEAALGLIEKKSNAITDKWKEDGAYTLMAGFLHNNPKAMEVFKAQLKAGKSPKQALKTAVEKEGKGTPFLDLSKADKYIGPEVQAIYGNLQKITTRAKSRLAALTAVADKADDITDPAEFTKLLREYGLGGAGIDSFAALEKRLSSVRRVLESPIGTYWGMFQTIYKGVEGKEPGGRASAMFTLMDETAGNLPILGEFVHLYMEMAKELLAATLRLKKKIAQWDMGCVGTGTHGITTVQNARGVAFRSKYPGMACPETTIKDLYVDFSDPKLLYFWTGKAWLKAPEGKGGASAVVRIIAMLKSVAKISPGVKADVPAAFAIFGINGGFKANQSAAETLYFDINHRWERLKQMMASLNIPKTRIIEILETRSGVDAGFDNYIDNHFGHRKNEIQFVYRYIQSRLGDGAMIRRQTDILDKLTGFHPTVILGTLEIPDGLDLTGMTPTFNITAKEGILIERQSISLAARSYRLVLFGGKGMQLGYDIELGDLRSKPLEVTNWKNMLTPQRAVFKAGLNVALTLPKRVEIGQEITLHGQITADAEPPFQLIWQVDGKPGGERTLNGPEFSIPQTFSTAGLHDFEVAVTDKRGFEGGDRADIPVAFKLTTEIKSTPDKGGQLAVIVGVEGGSGAYTVTWASDDGQKFQTEQGRDRFFHRFSDPGQSTLKWVDVSVFDHESRIEVPVRGNLDALEEMVVSLHVSPEKPSPGETVSVSASIAAGQPDFRLALYVNGKEMQRKSSDVRDAKFSLKLDEPGVYKLEVEVTDREGKTAKGTASVAIATLITVDIWADKTTIAPGDGVILKVDIQGGEPDFKLALLINGKEAQTRMADGRRGQFSVRFDKPGTYRLSISAFDASSTSAPKTILLTVEEPAAAAADGSYSGGADGKIFGNLMPGDGGKSLIFEARNTQIVLSVNGNSVTGRFTLVAEGYRYSVPTRLDCEGKGTVSDSGAISLPIFCKLVDDPAYGFTGSMNGQQAADGFRGKWGLQLSMGGGDWYATKQ